MDRWIKLVHSDETLYLLEHHPIALNLLTLISLRARIFEGLPDGLEIGEAHIGDYKSCGINSRQTYRTNLAILEKRLHIKIVETNRRTKSGQKQENTKNKKLVKKSTTGSTTYGTLVKILRSDVYDLNINVDNHQTNHHLTTYQPPTNHEQERTRKKEKEKETTPKPPNSGAVVVFFSLEKIDWLTQKEKERYTRDYSEEEVNVALAVVTAEDFEPQETIQKAFYVALRDGWQPSKKTCTTEDKKINHQIANFLETIKHDYYHFDSYPDRLVISGGQMEPKAIYYTISTKNFMHELDPDSYLLVKKNFNLHEAL